MIPFWGQKLAQDFDLVIHLDADSIVVDSLPELLWGDFDVAGVRNNDDFGDPNFTCPGVAVHEYMNCGLVAATHRQFWDDWLSANLESVRRPVPACRTRCDERPSSFEQVSCYLTRSNRRALSLRCFGTLVSMATDHCAMHLAVSRGTSR